MPTFNIGDTVLFGRENGEKTLGRVVKVNAASVKVEQTEARGGRPVGTIWRVAPSLVYPLEGSPALPALAPLVALPPMPGTARPSFRIGQRVAFTAKGRTVTGTVARVNEKTITVDHCDDGSRGWRVSPAMLALANAPATF
ncbi:MAG: hypothetical protein EB084_09400 [Proteobacteria bacterium]|nr:hypothetical protein [Pseudomonadota bacterium]